MRRFLALVLVLSHMNTSMFFPQVPEQDIYDSKGTQVDNITSVVELIRVKVGLDHTADNENDDRAQNLHPVKTPQYSSDNYFVTAVQKVGFLPEQKYVEKPTSCVRMPSYDILIPPPKV